MLMSSIALLFAAPEINGFPEKVPGLMEACLEEAVAEGRVTETEDSHKYICAGDPADRLWGFLEHARISSFEQDTPEGRWLSHTFPLGGCFKRVGMPGGGSLRAGLSCTIWVPRPAAGGAAGTP